MSAVVLSINVLIFFCFVFPFCFCTFIVRHNIFIRIHNVQKCSTNDCIAHSLFICVHILPAHSS